METALGIGVTVVRFPVNLTGRVRDFQYPHRVMMRGFWSLMNFLFQLHDTKIQKAYDSVVAASPSPPDPNFWNHLSTNFW